MVQLILIVTVSVLNHQQDVFNVVLLQVVISSNIYWQQYPRDRSGDGKWWQNPLSKNELIELLFRVNNIQNHKNIVQSHLVCYTLTTALPWKRCSNFLPSGQP